MKGIVLAGGLGTRLRPLTNVANKHLLPVYDKPMIFYPLELMANLPMITDVLIVIGGHGIEQITRLVKGGKDVGLRGVQYAYQEGEGGIADALSLAERFVGEDLCFVVLGDNIVFDYKEIAEQLNSFIKDDYNWRLTKPNKAQVWLKEVPNPEEYGCPMFTDSAQTEISYIEEKPKATKSPYAVVGMYAYSGESVFRVIREQKPSKRGELEITDVNMFYAREKTLGHVYLNGFWADAGSSIDALIDVGNVVRMYKKNELAKQVMIGPFVDKSLQWVRR